MNRTQRETPRWLRVGRVLHVYFMLGTVLAAALGVIQRLTGLPQVAAVGVGAGVMVLAAPAINRLFRPGKATGAPRGRPHRPGDAPVRHEEVKMEVKTFTYKNLAGTFFLQGWVSSQKMDEHIKEMLKDGWTVLNSADQPGDGRTFGPLVKRATITMTFKRG